MKFCGNKTNACKKCRNGGNTDILRNLKQHMIAAAAGAISYNKRGGKKKRSIIKNPKFLDKRSKLWYDDSTSFRGLFFCKLFEAGISLIPAPKDVANRTAAPSTSPCAEIRQEGGRSARNAPLFFRKAVLFFRSAAERLVIRGRSTSAQRQIVGQRPLLYVLRKTVRRCRKWPQARVMPELKSPWLAQNASSAITAQRRIREMIPTVWN